MSDVFKSALSTPQRARWQHQGVECAVHFHPGSGTFLGYCLIPKVHSLEQSPDWGEPWNLLDVHGGVTYGPEPANGGHIVGFDTGHASDYSYLTGTGRRWSLDEVIAETNRMAEQIAQVPA